MIATAISIFAATSIVSTAQAQVKCGGVNACKGMSACKTGSSACKGMNACKGQGYVETTDVVVQDPRRQGALRPSLSTTNEPTINGRPGAAGDARFIFSPISFRDCLCSLWAGGLAKHAKHFRGLAISRNRPGTEVPSN